MDEICQCILIWNIGDNLRSSWSTWYDELLEMYLPLKQCNLSRADYFQKDLWTLPSRLPCVGSFWNAKLLHTHHDHSLITLLCSHGGGNIKQNFGSIAHPSAVNNNMIHNSVIRCLRFQRMKRVQHIVSCAKDWIYLQTKDCLPQTLLPLKFFGSH